MKDKPQMVQIEAHEFAALNEDEALARFPPEGLEPRGPVTFTTSFTPEGLMKSFELCSDCSRAVVERTSINLCPVCTRRVDEATGR